MKHIKKSTYSIILLIASFCILAIVLYNISKVTYKLEFKQFQSDASRITAKQFYRIPVNSNEIDQLAINYEKRAADILDLKIKLQNLFINFKSIHKLLRKSFSDNQISTPIKSGFFIKDYLAYDSSGNASPILKNDTLILLYGESIAHSNYSQDFTFYQKGKNHFIEIVLRVEYPRLNKYIIQKSQKTIITSAIVLLIMFFIVLHTTLTIIRQKKLSDMKSDFINHITHELNTPLSVIQLATDTLKKNAIIAQSNENIQLIKMVSKQNRKLQHMITNVIDLNFLNKTSITITPQKTDIQTIETITNHLRAKYKNKEVELDIRSETKDEFFFDSFYFHVLIENLLENSIKYNHSKPTIQVSIKSNYKYNQLTFKDNGIGIAQKHLKKIFKKNYQVRSKMTTGLGFGLYYVKLIVDAHKGHINIQSKLNEGTSITIEIPKNYES